jgi:hypothetical protein
MTTLTVKINERNSLGKAIADLLRSTAKESKAVKLMEIKEESPYNAEFVAMIKEAEQRGKFREIDPNNVWESLGLK